MHTDLRSHGRVLLGPALRDLTGPEWDRLEQLCSSGWTVGVVRPFAGQFIDDAGDVQNGVMVITCRAATGTDVATALRKAS